MSRQYITISTTPGSPGGEILLRCPACGETSPMVDLNAQSMVCGWCQFHFPLEAGPRLELVVDKGSFQSFPESPAGEGVGPFDTGPARMGWATLGGRPLAIAVSDPASRWDAGEIRALVALVEQAGRERRPCLWVVTAPCGSAAPLHWPALQAAFDRVGEAGAEPSRGASRPWIALLAGPVYGPAAALALQSDLVLAEPGAVLAPVLPEILRQAGRLPLESTRPPRELLRAGWADAVLMRHEQRAALADLLDLLGFPGENPAQAQAPVAPLPEPCRQVLLSFRELSGDRWAGDDPALVGGLARLHPDGTRALVLAAAHGESQTGVRRHAGAIGASGWRKATRLLRLAGRLELPVVLLVDRPTLRLGQRDAPGEAAMALGETVHTLLSLPVPTIAVRMAAEDDLAGLSLSIADDVLAPEDLAPQLRQGGFPVDAVFRPPALASLLAQRVRELNQAYTLHGALGRRALWQRRSIRWGRLLPTEV